MADNSNSIEEKFNESKSVFDTLQNKANKDNIEEIENYINNLLKYYELAYTNYNFNVENYENYLAIQEDFNKRQDNFKRNYQGIEVKIDLKHREYQLLEYDNFIKEQTVHMLYILIIVLILCSIIIALNIFMKVPKSAITLAIVLVFGFYICYVLKLLLVDDTNMNIYNFHEYDYNKPTPQEITRGKTHSESQKRLREFEQDPVIRASQEAAQQEMLEKLKKAEASDSDLAILSDIVGDCSDPKRRENCQQSQ